MILNVLQNIEYKERVYKNVSYCEKMSVYYTDKMSV